MTIPNDKRSNQIENEIATAQDSAEGSKLLFAKLRATHGLDKASQLWWAYFSAFDAAET